MHCTVAKCTVPAVRTANSITVRTLRIARMISNCKDRAFSAVDDKDRSLLGTLRIVRAISNCKDRAFSAVDDKDRSLA